MAVQFYSPENQAQEISKLLGINFSEVLDVNSDLAMTNLIAKKAKEAYTRNIQIANAPKNE